MADELVSCLCVSRPQRYGQMQRAILNFLAQTYKYKELVIVVDGSGDYAGVLQSFIDQQLLLTGAQQIAVLPRMAKSQLEGLMYGAVHAKGEVLCLWDDDNINHSTRLNEQMIVQTQFRTAVTVLTEGMYYFHNDQELFVVDMNRPEGSVAHRTLPSSLMAFRQWFPILEPAARSKPSEQMLNNVARAGRKIVHIPGKPFLHTVGVTYDNLRTYEYHRLVAQERSYPAKWFEQRKTFAAVALDDYCWDATVSVEGCDAGAFEYKPKKRWPEGLYPVKLAAEPAKITLPKEPAVDKPPGK